MWLEFIETYGEETPLDDYEQGLLAGIIAARETIVTAIEEGDDVTPNKMYMTGLAYREYMPKPQFSYKTAKHKKKVLNITQYMERSDY